MLYFQLSEPEYNSLRRVQDQLGLISSLIIGAYPGHALEPVTPGQLLAFIQAQEEAGLIRASVRLKPWLTFKA